MGQEDAGEKRGRGGIVHGETDEFSYNIVNNPVHVRDFQATIMHQFGIQHDKFTFKYQGPLAYVIIVF